jgi:hypothetical protein
MTACAERSLVDRHFAGGIDPAGEHALRGHLPGCDGCRERYERHLLLARLTRSGPSAEDRLARGLGLAAPRRRWLVPSAVAVAVAVVLGLFVALPRREAGFQERGGPIATQGLRVYRVSSGDRLTPILGGSVAREDELAFGYENRNARRRLMIFGIDEAGRVYWYHPAWTDAAQNPVAVPVEPGIHDLPEAIAQPLLGHRLEIHALFTDDPLDVRSVERELAASGRVTRPGVEDVVVPFEVRP